MSDDVVFNTKGLDQLLKAMKKNMNRARVGVLGQKATRNAVPSGGRSLNAKNGPTAKDTLNAANNASLGAIHEFGTSKMPMRSFLRVPIADNLQKRLDNAGAFTEEEMKEVIRQGSFTPWLEKLAIIGEGIVQDAFDSGGFGKWPAWKTKGYSNNTGQILVDTQQLRNSISSEVK